VGILCVLIVSLTRASHEHLFSEGIKKTVSNDLFDISIPPAKLTGNAGKRKISYTVIVDNKSEYIMRDMKIYIKPEEKVRQMLSSYEDEEYLLCECDLAPYFQAIEDTSLQFSVEGTASFQLEEHMENKGDAATAEMENSHNVIIRLKWENGDVVYECPVTVKYEPQIIKK